MSAFGKFAGPGRERLARKEARRCSLLTVGAVVSAVACFMAAIQHTSARLTSHAASDPTDRALELLSKYPLIDGLVPELCVCNAPQLPSSRCHRNACQARPTCVLVSHARIWYLAPGCLVAQSVGISWLWRLKSDATGSIPAGWVRGVAWVPIFLYSSILTSLRKKKKKKRKPSRLYRLIAV